MNDLLGIALLLTLLNKEKNEGEKTPLKFDKELRNLSLKIFIGMGFIFIISYQFLESAENYDVFAYILCILVLGWSALLGFAFFCLFIISSFNLLSHPQQRS